MTTTKPDTSTLQPSVTLAEETRKAALDSAAAALAAIHMAKQLGAETSSRDGRSVSRLDPARLRVPIGDVLFGAAQLQVDFARRLFEFNRSASVLLRDRLRESLSRPEEKTVQGTFTGKGPHLLKFSIKNSARLARRFTFRAPSECAVSFAPPAVTIAASKATQITAEFRSLDVGVHCFDIAIESQGIRVEEVHFEITITGEP